MSDDAQRWKEKYLQSIEQQDKLERRWAARLDLLRRGLVRSTLAAEGTDRAVDQCMKEMRDVVRTDDMDAALAALLPRLEKAVLDSEQRRETRVDQISAALTALVTQLQKLPLPREVARPLKTFAKQLDGRVAQAREIPLLLSELSSLQGQALNNLEPEGDTARPGPGLGMGGGHGQQSPALLGEVLAGPLEVVGLLQEPLDDRQHPLPRRRQASQTLADPDEQFDAQLGLQLLDLAADAGLRGVQDLCHGCEIEALPDGFAHRAQLLEVHGRERPGRQAWAWGRQAIVRRLSNAFNESFVVCLDESVI